MLDAQVNASPKVTVIPAPFTNIAENVFPAVIIVAVAVNVIIPVWV